MGILLAVKCDILQRRPSAVESSLDKLNLASLEVREFMFSVLHNICGLSLWSIECFVIDIAGNRYVIPGLD